MIDLVVFYNNYILEIKHVKIYKWFHLEIFKLQSANKIFCLIHTNLYKIIISYCNQYITFMEHIILQTVHGSILII